MKRGCFRFLKYAMGASLAVIALTNCFGVSSFTALSPVNASRVKPPNARAVDAGSLASRDSRGERNLLLNPTPSYPIGSAGYRADYAAKTSAPWPFVLQGSPIISATKTDNRSTPASPGDTLMYTVVISNTGTGDATAVSFNDTIDAHTTLVPGSLAVSPIAVNDTYHTIGNVGVTVPAGQGVIFNDLNPNGSGTLTVTKINATNLVSGTATVSTPNGSVTIMSDGSFTYNPNAGFSGPTDSFTYTLDNGTGKFDTATVTINVAGLIWFVDNTPGPNGDGRLNTPFRDMAGAGNSFDANAADAANDVIFIYAGTGNYTGGLTLLSGQKMIGKGAGASIETITGFMTPSGNTVLPATGGTNPAIAAAGANILLGSGNTIRGVTLNGTAAAAVNLTGTSFGTLTLAETVLGGTGRALSLTTGTLSGPVSSTAAFTSISSTGSSSTGISLTSVAGSMSSGSTTVTNPSGAGISVNTSSAALSFGATSATSSGGSGISLTTNTGTITFGALTITPDANQKGLLATDNTNTITIPSGSVTTSGNTAVEITRSSGATPLAVTLTSVSANGGTNGIVLTNTSGSFTVTGNGSTVVGGDNSGGSLQNLTNGAALNNAMNLSFTNVQILNTSGSGVNGTKVTNFTFKNGSIDNSGTGLGAETSNIAFNTTAAGTENNLAGTVTITSNSLTNAFYHGIDIFDFNGTISDANISTNTITSTNSTATSKGSGIRFIAFGSASTIANVTKATIANNIVSNFPSATGIQAQGGNGNAAGPAGVFGTAGSGTDIIAITGNTVKGFSSANRIGTQAILAVVNGKGQGNFNISNNGTVANPITNVSGTALAVSSFGFANVTATVANNVIVANHAASTGASGIGAGTSQTFASSDTPTLTVSISNNNVSQTDGNGIIATARDATGHLNVSIKNNTVAAPLGGIRNGIRVDAGNGVSVDDDVCLDISGNTTAGTGHTNAGIGLRKQGTSTTVNAFGIEGMAATSTPGVEQFVGNGAGQNPGSENGTSGDGSVNGVLLISATSGFSNCATAPAMVADPAQQFADVRSGGRESHPSGATDDTLYVTRHEKLDDKDVEKLDQTQLNWIAGAAIERWRQAGVSAEAIARMEAATFEIENLPANELAQVNSSRIKIDETADGYGWYFDQSPFDDGEFDVLVSGRELQTTELSPAHGKMDLLTVVMRELGRFLLQDKDNIPNNIKDGIRPLMESALSPATRRMPLGQLRGALAPGRANSSSMPGKLTSRSIAPGQSGASQPNIANSAEIPVGVRYAAFNQHGGEEIAAARDAELRMPRERTEGDSRTIRKAGMSAIAPAVSGETINKSLGTIPPGKSVTIMFQATIDNPLPPGVTQVCNQGTISGSNFSNVLTDDPDTGAAGDPTCTTVCVPAVITVPLTNQQVAQGATATFTTTLQGNVPFVPVWKKNGTTIVSGVSPLGARATINTTSGASTTTTTLTITGTMLSDSDTYTVDATDACNNPAAQQSATLTVVAPPTVSKAFGAASVPLNGSTTLTLTLTNPNTGVTLTGVNFSDNMPAGLEVANPPGISSTCSGTWNATPGDTTLNFGGGTLPPNSSCTLMVNIKGTTAGVKNNATNAPQSNEGGFGVASNTATLTVVAPPTISKGFAPGSVFIGGAASQLTFTLSNPNTTVGLTGVAFTDVLPSGLQVAATPNASTTCGGTFAPSAGDTTLTFSGGSIAASGTCTVKVNIIGASAGAKANTTGAITSTEGGTGATSNTATLNVFTAPQISKAFGASSIAVGGTTTLTFMITNPAVNPGTLTTITFIDSLPSGMVVATPNGVSNTCSGSVTAVAGSGTVSLGGASVAPGNTCQVVVNVTATTSGVKNNSVTVSSGNGGTGNTANASITVATPPTLSKSFGAMSIPVGGTTSLTFMITNPNSGTALSGISFTDTLPAGLTVPTTSSSTCGGTLTTTAPSTISFSAGTVAASDMCSFSVTVTGITAGVWNNTTGVISSTESGAGATSNTASLAVIGGAFISKAFGSATIPLNGVTTLTFTITNPNPMTALTGVAFTDALPSGLQVASTPNASTSCGGTFTPSAGDTTLTFSGGTILASGSCTVAVDVTGTTVGVKNNTSGAVTASNAPDGNTASASVTVLGPPTISKAFGSPNIPLGGTTSLMFTITNPNSTASLTGVAFTDVLPAGLTVADSSSSQCGGTVTTVNATGTITLSGATIAASGTCTFSVTVTGATVGVKNNTTGAVTSANGGTGATSNTATVTVATAPTITKAFGVLSVVVGDTTSLTFMLSNPNGSLGLTGVSFTDTLPAGVTVASSSTSTCGGTLTTTAPSTISFTGGVLAANGSCNFGVTVTGASAGVWNNTTGAISSNESGAGAASNTATLTVIGAPTVSKSFDAATIPLNGTSVLTFTISNSNTTTALTGVNFTDTLPSGLTVATSGPTAACGGTVTTTAPNLISFSGGSINPSSNCQFSVTATGATAGVKNNTTGTISSANGGTGGTSNTATITVVAPPTISKGFGAANIPLGGTTSLMFTINNPNSTVGLTGVGFTDTLPAGLTAPDSGPTAACGGSVTVSSNVITLTGASIAASGSCMFNITVTGATAGVKNNTTSAVSSTNGGTGATSNTATLAVASPPTISKSFGAATIPLSTTTTLSFTITNTNSVLGITGVGFTDALPAGLTIGNSSSSVCGGTLTTTAPGTITLAGASIAASGTCTFNVSVTGATAGVKNNTTGAVSSTETGAGATSNTATVTVLAAPAITKAFGGPTVPLNGVTTLTFTINNPNGTVALTGVGFTDNLPAGLRVASPPNASTSCGGTVTAVAGGSTIGFSGGTVPAGGTCTITVNVTGIAAGVNNNTTGAVTSANGGTGVASNTATITVVAPPTIAKAFSSPTILLNGTATLTFTLTNPNLTVALTGVAFTDVLPAGLQVANPPGAVNNCGGTFTPLAGDTTLTFTNGVIGQNSSCTISVVVTATTGGIKNNTTGPITSANGGTGLPSNTATISTFDVCLQDDLNHGYILQFSSITGDYLFTYCGPKGFTMSGKGAISRPDACTIKLRHDLPDRQITAYFYTCPTGDFDRRSGSASINVIKDLVKTPYSITDHKTDDDTCSCPQQ